MRSNTRDFNAMFNSRSSFDMVLTSRNLGWHGITVERIRTSPGFNTSLLPHHALGLHLGSPVSILHRRDHMEKLHHFRKGDIVFTPAGSPIYYAHSEMVDGLYILINPLSITAFAESMDIPSSHIQLHDNLGHRDTIIEHIGHELIQELSFPELGGRLYIDSLITQLLIHLLRHYNQKPEHPFDQQQAVVSRLNPALDFIQVHLRDDLSLDNLAASVHLTPYHFSRLFKRAFGVSPHQYVIQQRVEAAKRLLNDPNLTVMEVAAKVGFSDHSHLTRHFKRLTGETPRAK